MPKKLFGDGKVGHGSVNAIFSRPEAADDVISGQNVKAVEGYVVVNFEVASLSSFELLKKPFRCGGRGGGGCRYTI